MQVQTKFLRLFREVAIGIASSKNRMSLLSSSIFLGLGVGGRGLGLLQGFDYDEELTRAPAQAVSHNCGLAVPATLAVVRPLWEAPDVRLETLNGPAQPGVAATRLRAAQERGQSAHEATWV